MLFRAPVPFLVFVVACVAAPTSPTSAGVNTSDPEFGRRWWSVPDDRGILPGGYRAWPSSDDGLRTINYCFEDAETHTALGAMFDLALAKWTPATRMSSLNFAPDPACQTTPCLCSEPDVAKDHTLHIMLLESKVQAWATFGYTPPFFDAVEPSMPRHHLVWTKDPVKRAPLFGPDAPVRMAHELGKYFDGKLRGSSDFGALVVRKIANCFSGHVIGLHHEHQRPDASTSVKFDCRFLQGYEKARTLVESIQSKDEPAFAEGMSIVEKMHLVLVYSQFRYRPSFAMTLLTLSTSCTRVELARKYFVQAAGWMPDVDDVFEVNLQHSKPFDYKSIMIYGSKIGRAQGADGYPLVTTDGDVIHMGGDADPEQARISDLDIERVKELYPKESKDPHSPSAASPSTPGELETKGFIRHLGGRRQSKLQNVGGLYNRTVMMPTPILPNFGLVLVMTNTPLLIVSSPRTFLPNSGAYSQGH